VGVNLVDRRTGESTGVLGVNRNLLVASDDLSPLSDVPRLSGTPVSITMLDRFPPGQTWAADRSIAVSQPKPK
jgi:hypothetical protein